MTIIVPMAGMGKRMRPHTLITPKPLLPIAGKPMVERIVDDIAAVCVEEVDEIAFVIGDFGQEVEANLLTVAKRLGAKGSIYYQQKALGTAHAIWCARESLKGKVVVAFADTLFKADFKLDEEKEGIIWVQQIEDPSAFGVVKVNTENVITDFVEKPQEFVSDLAIIGIYYFRDGANLRKELQYLIDNDVTKGGEYQLTDALENMKAKGIEFSPGTVDEWLDCGNKDATVYTNQRILELHRDADLVSTSVKTTNATILQPCYIGENVVIDNSTVGPYVSIGDDSSVVNAKVANTIILSNCTVRNVKLTNSMIGNFVEYEGNSDHCEVSIGDYSTVMYSSP